MLCFIFYTSILLDIRFCLNIRFCFGCKFTAKRETRLWYMFPKTCFMFQHSFKALRKAYLRHYTYKFCQNDMKRMLDSR